MRNRKGTRITENLASHANPSAPTYDSYCVVCGSVMKQLVPDDPDNRGICYHCYSSMWGKQSVRQIIQPLMKKARAA